MNLSALPTPEEAEALLVEQVLIAMLRLKDQNGLHIYLNASEKARLLRLAADITEDLEGKAAMDFEELLKRSDARTTP